ncbi:MAG: patatin-like phospholipase family protein [Candidatus Azotimanducaceae bacterium]|uniref:Patatin-like phospholipase family protein n=1 Tax=OM182 bacterium TaxID=2510334 RepID=A0A520RZN1_9GAMM|nr:alpha/beta hydrolase [Gammaproteobacteria bacterium]RZO75690.1 MAG: patatin-like phospholipase family protein [OM182 bacterium]
MTGINKSDFPLSIVAGKSAYEALQQNGWDPSQFSALIGASGGAKLLGIAHLDRFLFGDYLQRSNHTMSLYGSSIGAWRHAALAGPNPLEAIIELQYRYLNQDWDENDQRSRTQVVDSLCRWIIDGVIDKEKAASICSHPRFTTHIVTARGRGLNSHRYPFSVGTGMTLGAIGNLVKRSNLSFFFQRVVFTAGGKHDFKFQDFQTYHAELKAEDLRTVLLASGAIPFLMSSKQNIQGAPRGLYWDGGIIDYHFDFDNHHSDGLALYPHFSAEIIKGWFDKSIPWRRNSATSLDQVVIISPSKSYLANLPYNKIPDRKDFARMSKSERKSYWNKAVDASQRLAEAFASVVEAENPAAQVIPL